ncbi:MAG TPA: 50S ribosomal protein L10 [Anaerolineae bacterium]|nr:50S ribosomal protein L10 [Anaerolineae bacterium]
MAISRKRKEELLAQYIELLSDSRAIVLAEYQGMQVKDLEALRGEVRQVDSRFHITKNTLFKNALEQTGKPVPTEMLVGQMAAGFAAQDAPSLAKALVEFAKKEDRLIIKGAILGDEILDAEGVEALAKLPSLEELRGQLVGLVSAPARNLASVVASGVRQVVNVLDAYAKKEETEAADTA